MEIRGIKKGDKDLRHFTFDDEDVVVRGGVYFYKVKYDKSPLEGEYADEEDGYVECDKVIPLGGKRPKPIPGREKKTEEKLQEAPVTVKKSTRGRPPKVKKVEPPSETIPIAPQEGVQKYEYHVTYLGSDNRDNLEDELNTLGDAGWELCGFDSNRGLIGSMKIVAIFKRKRG